MKYTNKQLRVVYKALKGANLLGNLSEDTGYNRQSIFNTFNAPDVQYNESIALAGIKMLKRNGILQDTQLLTELLNS